MHLLMVFGALAVISVMSTTRQQIAEADARMRKWNAPLLILTGLIWAALLLPI